MISNNNIVLWMPANEGTGSTAYDYSGNAHNGTITGSGWTTRSQNGENVLSFNGSSSRIRCADSSNWDIADGDYTISFWVKHTDHAGTEPYFQHTANATHTWGFVRNDTDGIIFYYYNTAYTTGSPMIFGYDITDTNWHHVVLTRNTNDYKLYVDGQQRGSTVTATGTYNSSGELSIGDNGLATVFFDGKIADIRIYKTKGISISEIKQIYKETYRE